ncbi:MAG: response regulator [Phycisphaeraceae bacterium]|nr:response regulator [Phycisphaeraceae bacterium]
MTDSRAQSIPKPEHRPLILIVDDEEPIRRFLRATLEHQHYRTKEAATANEGLILARTQRPDLVLLDLGLPDGDGLHVTRSLRADSSVPIVVLSAREQEQDKVNALDTGADDYLTKPFSIPELLARIRVALRHANTRAGAGSNYETMVGDHKLWIDLESRSVRVSNAGTTTDVRLTPTEFQLLAFLVKHAGKVLTHQMILKEVWGPTHANDIQYLRVYAGQLRRKIEADPAQPVFLLTEPGVGYRLAASGSDGTS